MIDKMRKFYDENADFKHFVDANAKAYGKTVEFMLSTETTKQYFLSMQKGGINEQKRND